MDITTQDLLSLILSGILAVVGLVCTVLEQLGKLRPVLRRTGSRISYASGGVYVLIAAIMGFMNLYWYNRIWAAGYPLALGAGYWLIRLVIPKTK